MSHRPTGPPAAPLSDDTPGWYRMRPIELAAGYVFGHVDTPRCTARGSAAPRAVLERLLTTALRQEPCVVAFSGGRDSSALLALAVNVARRQGLALPVPVTRRFVGHADADESDWQELVIRHLGLTDWVRLHLHDDCDLLGPYASRLLRAHGPYWPAAAHTIIPVLEVARGGTVLTGEGGDEVFGIRRATPLRHLVSGASRRAAALQALPWTVGPRSVRARWLTRVLQAETPDPWLTREGQREVARLTTNQELDEPLSWRASTRQLADRRSWVHGAATLDRVALAYDVSLHHPLLEPSFLDALASSGTLVGPVSRPEAMRALFAHVLPDTVVRRRSKATFNTALFTEKSRRFAEQWTGSGVDLRLIDVEGLHAAWSNSPPNGRTFALLQSAWLNTAMTGPAADDDAAAVGPVS